jgi:hypothetical protein
VSTLKARCVAATVILAALVPRQNKQAFWGQMPASAWRPKSRTARRPPPRFQ